MASFKYDLVMGFNMLKRTAALLLAFYSVLSGGCAMREYYGLKPNYTGVVNGETVSVKILPRNHRYGYGFAAHAIVPNCLKDKIPTKHTCEGIYSINLEPPYWEFISVTFADHKTYLSQNYLEITKDAKKRIKETVDEMVPDIRVLRSIRMLGPPRAQESRPRH
jgi:hypothetical protein